MDNYSWGQSLQEVNVTVSVPRGTKSKFIACEIKKNHLKVGLKGDQKAISILLTKHNKMEWWKYLVKGEPEIDTQKAEPESSEITDLVSEKAFNSGKDDGKICILIVNVFSLKYCVQFDRRQKSMGLPTSDEMQKQEILKKFMAEVKFEKALPLLQFPYT
ncbi:unnamed protein product [Fraxinus pennsylvanica]|uniref:CS domain-containing protein n=1 Tax=Fraxinus pennsylvanica TaxID=56036 RepID=A0AAD2AE17_9LAMI|nr:unnamed protein product [Fraxinus pennsylvanica]